jgi:hypothetical protein
MLAVPAILLGMSPGVVHADDGSAVWKVAIGSHAQLRPNTGPHGSVRIPVEITCPSGARNVVIDVSAHQSLDQPNHESEGEAESLPVTCKGEGYVKMINVPCEPDPLSTDPDVDVCPYIKGALTVSANLDQASVPTPAGQRQDGKDMASADRVISAGTESEGTNGFVDISGGTLVNGGNKVAVRVDYSCPTSAGSVDIRAYVDQDLGPSHETSGSGDAEGLATKTGLSCNGEDASTTILVESGKPTTATEGETPCRDQNTPAPVEAQPGTDNTNFTPETGGTFASGKACIQVQIVEGPSAGGDIHSQQEGVFRLSADD